VDFIGEASDGENIVAEPVKLVHAAAAAVAAVAAMWHMQGKMGDVMTDVCMAADGGLLRIPWARNHCGEYPMFADLLEYLASSLRSISVAESCSPPNWGLLPILTKTVPKGISMAASANFRSGRAYHKISPVTVATATVHAWRPAHANRTISDDAILPCMAVGGIKPTNWVTLRSST
jgi:hypothetical protein